MLITNILEFNNLDLYKCDINKAIFIQLNGFHLMGYDEEGNYYFRRSKELLNFLKKDGDKNE